MKLLVDEDTQAHRLLDALRSAGHDVFSVAELGCNGQPDPAIFMHAQEHQRVLLTHNVADFLELARQADRHAGILAIFRDGDPRKIMRHADIVHAIAALGGRWRCHAGPVPYSQPLALRDMPARHYEYEP